MLLKEIRRLFLLLTLQAKKTNVTRFEARGSASAHVISNSSPQWRAGVARETRHLKYYRTRGVRTNDISPFSKWIGYTWRWTNYRAGNNVTSSARVYATDKLRNCYRGTYQLCIAYRNYGALRLFEAFESREARLVGSNWSWVFNRLIPVLINSLKWLERVE